jgi:hypothetical protein
VESGIVAQSVQSRIGLRIAEVNQLINENGHFRWNPGSQGTAKAKRITADLIGFVGQELTSPARSPAEPM